MVVEAVIELRQKLWEHDKLCDSVITRATDLSLMS